MTPSGMQGPAEEGERSWSPLTVLVWAADPAIATVLERAAIGEGRTVIQVLDGDVADMAYRRGGDLLVAEDGAHLVAQRDFLRIPLVLVTRPGAQPTPKLAQRAYAIVHRPAEIGLAIDRFEEHRRLSEQAARRREPPRRCSRCGRGYDPGAVRRGGIARKFVRFGAVSLCGGCVEKLRTLLQSTESPLVEAGSR